MNKKLRKKPALPGGHLQPLLRNNAIKTKLAGNGSISSTISDTQLRLVLYHFKLE